MLRLLLLWLLRVLLSILYEFCLSACTSRTSRTQLPLLCILQILVEVEMALVPPGDAGNVIFRKLAHEWMTHFVSTDWQAVYVFQHSALPCPID